MTDVAQEVQAESRVTGFSAPFSFHLGDMVADVTAQQLDSERTYSPEEVVEIVRLAGGVAAVSFFERVGSGEIDVHTGAAGEVIRFTADAERSSIAEGSRWSWLSRD